MRQIQAPESLHGLRTGLGLADIRVLEVQVDTKLK